MQSESVTQTASLLSALFFGRVRISDAVPTRQSAIQQTSGLRYTGVTTPCYSGVKPLDFTRRINHRSVSLHRNQSAGFEGGKRFPADPETGNLVLHGTGSLCCRLGVGTWSGMNQKSSRV